jgi:hypothetical protein
VLGAVNSSIGKYYVERLYTGRAGFGGVGGGWEMGEAKYEPEFHWDDDAPG